MNAREVHGAALVRQRKDEQGTGQAPAPLTRGQFHDRFNVRWVAARGMIILAPACRHLSPSPLTVMLCHLVSADGGDSDPTATQGEPVAEAKAIEQSGWDCPKHLAGRPL